MVRRSGKPVPVLDQTPEASWPRDARLLQLLAGSRPMKCELCQNNASVHFILKPTGEVEEGAQEISHFCTDCGRTFAGELAPGRLIGYCADTLPGESELMRQFCVIGERADHPAILEVAEVRQSMPGVRRWGVPAVLVPADQRYPGGEFAIYGSPLEFEIFMTWFK